MRDPSAHSVSGRPAPPAEDTHSIAKPPTLKFNAGTLWKPLAPKVPKPWKREVGPREPLIRD